MNQWKRTGTPAHNKAVQRSAEDEPEWEADPACQDCGGSGFIWTESPVRNYEGEAVDVEFINEPCHCIFQRWVMKADTTCPQCKGTGAVQERLIHPDTKEEYIKFHDCVCLRLVKEMINDE
jgi:RecJ-like exonuclease